MCCDLFVILLLAHVLGDFYCQTDKHCQSKREKKFKSWFLYVHSAIIGILSWLFVWDWSFGWCALLIIVSHFVIDVVKCFVKNDNLLPFAIDQVLHLAIIAIICGIWKGGKFWIFPEYCYWMNQNLIVVITCVLVLAKPSNIVIKKILDQYKITTDSDGSIKESNSVGSLIGTTERILSFLLIIIGQINAVGFLLAAKSILRFRDIDTVKTEYVLAGTLLSFGIAVVVGILVINGMLS